MNVKERKKETTYMSMFAYARIADSIEDVYGCATTAAAPS